MEMFKALSAVSVDNSIFRVGPQDNPWLLLGVSGPFLLHLFVLYSSKLGIPALGESFGMVRIATDVSSLPVGWHVHDHSHWFTPQVPLSIDDWVTVLAWAAPILLVDEILKAIGRWLYREERKGRGSRVDSNVAT
jgi:Ca2+-transporting ATPase